MLIVGVGLWPALQGLHLRYVKMLCAVSLHLVCAIALLYIPAIAMCRLMGGCRSAKTSMQCSFSPAFIHIVASRPFILKIPVRGCRLLQLGKWMPM